MFVMDTLKVNNNGNLELGGLDVQSVAREFGTPLYIMDEDKIRQNCRVYTKSINDYYGGNGLALYAGKALACKYIFNIIKEENMGLDVSSGGELFTALSCGFPAEKIYFHGNHKIEDELFLALDAGVGRFVVDNKSELELLNRLAVEKGKVAQIAFRVKPGVEAHTHEFIRTGQIDSKFGFTLETGEAEEIIKIAAALEGVKVVGVHCHIGSQIFDRAPFELAARIMLEFIADMRDKHGVKLTELNLGGGFGIKYTDDDNPISYDHYIAAIAKVVDEVCAERNIQRPFILMEPGRSIVADAGLTVYTVGEVKEIPNIRTYVVVDGGMTDNPRHIMYDAKYDAKLVSNPCGAAEQTVTIAGRCCESGDVLIRDIGLPKVKVGDMLAVLSTGAYNYSMASNYNRIPRPPIVMISNGEAKLAVRRESYEDLIRNDM
ncbi:MAG: diaminopimelate decarboxylase [Oscillospiraceae bacterium]|nr:diaminopimelate decarboxylase [Oscillospiraceae bacterium]